MSHTLDATTIMESADQVKQDRMRKSLLAVLITTFVVTSVLYSFTVPIFEAQDEEAHFRYIRHFATRMSLPDYRKVSDLESAGYQSHQTPLYYFFQGILLRLSGQSYARLRDC